MLATYFLTLECKKLQYAELAQLEGHYHGKIKVTSSILVFGSIKDCFSKNLMVKNET